MKIYIIGPPGSGKTTLAKKLSREYNIDFFELDVLVFDDEHDHIRRSDEKIAQLFNKIIKKKSWIIEDVGRSQFQKGIELCDKIYYLQFSKLKIYKRIIKRWIKQKRGIESYHYPPTFAQLIDMIKVVNSYFKKEPIKLKELNKYNDKVVFVKQ